MSGIVVTLDPGPEAPERLRERLAGDDRFTLGETQGPRLPVVCDTPDLPGHRAAWDDLPAMPEVSFVELAYHDFSDVEDFGAQPPRRRRRS